VSYTLQAIIGHRESFDAAHFDSLSIVGLADGLLLIPLTSAVRTRFDIPYLPLTDDRDDAPSAPHQLNLFCSQLSRQGLIAYLEAEIFGGVGWQAHVLYRNGAAVGPPDISADAINQALRLFGVQVDGHTDEFDAVGLGRHRDTDAWSNEQD
jgi:hypothetical protein